MGLLKAVLFGVPLSVAAARIFYYNTGCNFCQEKNTKIIHKSASRNLCILSIAFVRVLWYYNYRKRGTTQKKKNKKFFQKGIDKHQNIMYNLIKEKEKRGNKDDE